MACLSRETQPFPRKFEGSAMAVSIWDRVHAIEGGTLETLERKTPFKIVQVTRDYVMVKPLMSKTGASQPVQRADIEWVADKGWRPNEIRKRTLLEKPNVL
jgi:hypothetical protein